MGVAAAHACAAIVCGVGVGAWVRAVVVCCAGAWVSAGVVCGAGVWVRAVVVLSGSVCL